METEKLPSTVFTNYCERKQKVLILSLRGVLSRSDKKIIVDLELAMKSDVIHFRDLI